MNFKLISFLFAWIFPTKQDRRIFRNLCRAIEKRKLIPKIYKNYDNRIQYLRQKIKNNKKINVIFLSSTPAKWPYIHLYKLFNNDRRFDVKVLITVYDFYLKNKYPNIDHGKLAEENLLYFKDRGCNASYAFDIVKNKHIDLKQFNPDIVFYEQPWGLASQYLPYLVSEYALTFYSSYGAQITNGSNEYSEDLYNTVYQYYIDNPYIKDFLVNKHNYSPDHLNISGHPKLDAYLKPVNLSNQIWNTNKKRIIWAPHHSFLENSTLKFGTFDWNYEFMYNFAKEHTEYEFVFKPHPELKRTIVQEGFMTQEVVENYWSSWQNLSNAKIYEKSDYFDMFRTSDLLVTDCNSFLYEYLPSEKPVIHLLNTHSVGHNEFGQKIIQGYYKVNNIVELQKYLNEILVNNSDPLFNKRKEIIDTVLNQPNGGVANYIYNHVLSILLL